MDGASTLVVIFFGGVFCVMVGLSVWEHRRLKRLDERATASGRLLDDWLARTTPCPTCGGSGRVLAHDGRARQRRGERCAT